eukprot:1180884-Prorocentrum_minimum.AAC.2
MELNTEGGKEERAAAFEPISLTSLLDLIHTTTNCALYRLGRLAWTRPAVVSTRAGRAAQSSYKSSLIYITIPPTSTCRAVLRRSICPRAYASASPPPLFATLSALSVGFPASPTTSGTRYSRRRAAPPAPPVSTPGGQVRCSARSGAVSSMKVSFVHASISSPEAEAECFGEGARMFP